MTIVEPTERQLALVPMRDPEIGLSISARMHKLAARYAAALAQDPPGGGPIADRAREVHAALIGASGDARAQGMAEHIVANLIDPAELSTVQFWETGLGRALAARGAFPEPWMTRSIAAALLDVSRQRIGQMVAQAMLVEHGGRLTRDSVTRYLSPA